VLGVWGGGGGWWGGGGGAREGVGGATACFTVQTVIRFSRTLVNVMGECCANETVQ